MQTILAAKTRASFVKVRCSSEKKDSAVTVARKAFEKKRAKSVKENFNKLLVVANSDVKEIGDFLKELDEIHKKEMSVLFDKVKTKVNVQEEDEENDDTNIFAKSE